MNINEVYFDNIFKIFKMYLIYIYIYVLLKWKNCDLYIDVELKVYLFIFM